MFIKLLDRLKTTGSKLQVKISYTIYTFLKHYQLVNAPVRDHINS